MIRRLGLALMAAVMMVGSLVLAEAPAFEKGERVCFLGDSIFHGGKVHADLLLFYATRFPEAPMRFYNAGVAGDMAKEATRRLEWEVRPHSPTVTVVMFGMNDVGRWLYGEGKESAGVLEQRRRMMEEHVRNMERIAGELKQMGSRIVICTPTPFDQTTQRKTENARGVDDALAEVAANGRRLAREGGYGLVDFHAEMGRVLREQQAKDPAFTMMDAARVHPDGAGHLLMTYIFLKAQGMTPTVSRVVMDAQVGRDARVVEAENCSVSDVGRSEGGVRFECKANALPYPVSSQDAAALSWVPFMEGLNQETLVVRNLAPGEHEVLIDGQSVGKWSADALAKGVNLAGNTNTPQYKQAAGVMELNEKRRSRENDTLRVFAALEHDVLRPRGVDVSDMEAVRSAMDKAIEEEGRNKTWRHSYFINLSKVYYAQKPRQQAIEQELGEMTQRMLEMARPQVHRYEVR